MNGTQSSDGPQSDGTRQKDAPAGRDPTGVITQSCLKRVAHAEDAAQAASGEGYVRQSIAASFVAGSSVEAPHAPSSAQKRVKLHIRCLFMGHL
jgi:hypothetical protein